MLRLSIQLHNGPCAGSRLEPTFDRSPSRENARRQSREDTRCFAHRLEINGERIYGGKPWRSDYSLIPSELWAIKQLNAGDAFFLRPLVWNIEEART